MSLATISAALAADHIIIIGYAAAVTGALAPYDSPDGVKCRVEQLNAGGGIGGKPVELIVRDTKSDAVTASNVGQELLDLGANVLLGPPTDDGLIPIAQLALPQGIPVLSVGGTQPAFPLASPENGYLVPYGDNASASAAAEIAYKAGHRKVVLMIANDVGAYSAITPEYFGKAFERLGGKIVGRVNYHHGLADYNAQVTEVRSNPEKPDMIFAAILVPDAGVLVRTIKAAGLDIPVFGTDGFDDPSFIGVAGPGADLATFITHGFPAEGSPLKQFYDDCEKRGLKAQNIFFGLGGEAVDVIKAATEKAGSFDPPAINAAIKELDGLKGLTTGSITYKDRGGIPLKEMTVIQVKDGKFAQVGKIIPQWVANP
ncbi:ABC transporter substrate-binding protein [Mesorhizobium sp. CO1-1-8]|uniref:ABC transporter substrate-binding protein n=1 Tax=Mesorhizobium sp. CO1-1-8 TaxID=2876631 RepID=UPI001CD0A7B4|nr:ABC transporter substrate-binding protein [Mesorhizobium sp. CO1-1-8]MBZ9772473.1 ABC transporter substrate-binding protein [Mesorhizobium sp. CO1-1-8]